MSVTSIPQTDVLEGIAFTSSPEGDPITFSIGTHGEWDSGQTTTDVNEEITFTAAGDISEALRFEWDFGDGTRGVGNPVTHTFTIPNPFLRVSLRVTDTRGRYQFASLQMYLTAEGGGGGGGGEGILYGSDTYGTGNYGT